MHKGNACGLVLSVSLLSSPLANPSSLSAWKRLAKPRNQPDFPTSISEPKQRPINISPGLCIKTRLSAQPLIWKLFFILMMIKIIFHKKLTLCTWPHFESGDFSRDKLLLACEQQTHFRSSLLSLRKVPEMRLRFAG